MKNNQKASTNINNKNNNNINIENEEYEENYIKINTKNQFEINNFEESKKKLKEIIEYNEEEETNDELSDKFFNKLFPGCEKKAFLISKNIAKKIIISQKINNKDIEDKIKYFFEKQKEISYSTKLFLDKEAINNLGYILCYAYLQFDDFNISSKKGLNAIIKNKKMINTTSGFLKYCINNKKNPLDCSMFQYLESKNKKWCLPGVFMFLINVFECINTLEINMDIKFDNSKDGHHTNEFYLFIITQLNIHYLTSSSESIKIYFNNQKIQNDIYDYYTEELKSFYKSNDIYLKHNFEKFKNEKHKKRCDFDRDYLINSKRKRLLEKKPLNEKNKTNEDKDTNNDRLSFVDIDIVNEIDSSKKESKGRNRAITISTRQIHFNTESQKTPIEQSFPAIEDNYAKNNKIFKKNFTIVESLKKKKKINKYEEIIKNNKFFFEILYIIILHINKLNRLRNIDLVINDCYYKEFITYFGRYDSTKTYTYIQNFHILNNFILKMNKIESLNIEFNSLDYLTFTKFLSFMSKNENIKSLKISFFSSLITYSPQFIYKLYHQNDENNEINNFNYNNDTPISFILNELLPYFIDNIQAIFELIRSKKHLLQILNLIFDIPEIIAVKQSYLNGILKLILNILLLIDNKNSVITQLAILSPKIIIDSRSMPNVEDIIDCINIEKNNKTIKELTMQMQLYQINNIKNFISSNLIKLKIGEVDIITLKQLTKYLCSFTFFKKSSLKLLSIGILNHIIHFSKEVEYLLNEIFSIKIKKLKEINVC